MLGFGPLAELNFEPATDLSGPLHFHTHCAATPVGTVVSPLIAHLPPAIYGNIPIYLGAVLPSFVGDLSKFKCISTLFTNGCLNTSKFRQTCDILLWTEVIVYNLLKTRCS
jgi:hypothetical protein